MPTTADYEPEREDTHIAFEWPVGVDLRDLAVALPPEIASVESAVTPDGAMVSLALAKGVTPRFYENSPSQYILDIDIAGVGLPSFTAASLAEESEAAPEAAAEAPAGPDTAQVDKLFPESAAPTVTPG